MRIFQVVFGTFSSGLSVANLNIYESQVSDSSLEGAQDWRSVKIALNRGEPQRLSGKWKCWFNLCIEDVFCICMIGLGSSLWTFLIWKFLWRKIIKVTGSSVWLFRLKNKHIMSKYQTSILNIDHHLVVDPDWDISPWW